MSEQEMLKVLNGMSLYVRRAWDHTMPVAWEIGKRYIFDYEILYIKEGEVEMTIDGETLTGRPGDIFFIPPRVVHSIKSRGPERVRQPHIHFDFFYDEHSEALEIPLSYPHAGYPYIRRDIGSEPRLKLPRKIVLKSTALFESLLFDIILEQQSQNPLSVLKKKSLLFELLYVLYSSLDYDDDKEREQAAHMVKMTNDFIRLNCDRNLTTAEIACEMGYSKNYFVSVYKAFYGMTPIRYHENIRTDKAESLLLTTDMTITAVAIELGFDSVYSFSRYFRRIVGCYPQQYRRTRG